MSLPLQREEQGSRHFALQLIRTELEEALQKNEKWFRVDESKEEAELVVDLLAYWVRVAPKNNARIRWQRGGGNTMHADEFREQHSLRAITTVFGTPRDMTGVQVKRGGSAKGAARDLAKQLERYVKENYWELANRRVARR